MNHQRIPDRFRTIRLILISTAVILTHKSGSFAAWPQWGGPDRNFTVRKARLDKAWPDDGPKKLWSRPLGDGFSCIVTDGRTLYTMYRADDTHEAVIALDAKTGKEIWEHRYPAPYIDEGGDRKQDTQFGKGPNSTPLLANGRLYTVGFSCIMHCMDVESGKPAWSHDLFKEFGASLPMFGYAASPIAYEDIVIAPVGGDGKGIMAFDARSGKVRWKNFHGDASYSSPIILRAMGQDHLVAYLSKSIFGVNPKDGDVHWSLEHKNPTNANSICTPIACPGGRVYFVNFGDTAGGRMVRLEKNDKLLKPVDVWVNKKLNGGISDAVRIGEHFYAANGKGILAAFRADTGEIVWEQRGFPGAKLVVAGNRLIVLDDEGNLMLARPAKDGLEVISKAAILEKPSWTSPTLDNGILYLRDRKSILALDLR